MLKSSKERKATGSHFTPLDLAAFVAQEMLKLWQPLPNQHQIRVFDPALGDGELLLAILRNLKEKKKEILVSGFETDKQAMLSAEERVRCQFPQARIRFHNEDFLDQAIEYLAPPNLFQNSQPEQFDLVISNPPYVRTQVMGAKKSQILARQFALTGRADLYYAFILAIAPYLNPNGVLGIIVSNRFMTTKSGEIIRKRIQELYDIVHIWDLGDTKLFDAAVLPAVMMLKTKSSGRSNTAVFTSIYTTDPVNQARKCSNPIEALQFNGYVKTESNGYYKVQNGILDSGSTPQDVWRISTAESRKWLRRVEENTAVTFRDIDKIRVGVKTTADRVFIRSDWDEMPMDERPELLRALTTHHIGKPYRSDIPKTKILYPHIAINGKRTAVDLSQYPKSKAYLETHRKQLESRKYLIEAGRAWYEIWVPQCPKTWEKPKIVFRDITEHPAFWLDREGTVVNGDCYWISCEEKCELAWLALAVGNSSFIECFYDRRFNNKLYAGRRRFLSQYVEKFPLPRSGTPFANQLIKIAKQIFESAPEKPCSDLIAIADDLVWKAFGFSDEKSRR